MAGPVRPKVRSPNTHTRAHAHTQRRSTMIKIGDRIPDATLTETTEFGEACPIAPQKVQVAEAAKGKRIVVFGVPGAYTPTCSAKHVPGYLQNLDALKSAKVDEVWCIAQNDGFV